MYLTPEQMQASTKSNLEAILSLATSQFAALEKLAGLNANAVKTAFEDSIANARAVAGARDVQELVTLQESFAQRAIDQTIAYARSVHDVATHAGAEASKIADEGIAAAAEPMKSHSKPRRAA